MTPRNLTQWAFIADLGGLKDSLTEDEREWVSMQLDFYLETIKRQDKDSDICRAFKMIRRLLVENTNNPTEASRIHMTRSVTLYVNDGYYVIDQYINKNPNEQ